MTDDQISDHTIEENRNISPKNVLYEENDDVLPTPVDVCPDLHSNIKAGHGAEDEDERIAVDITTPETIMEDVDNLHESDQEDQEMQKSAELLLKRTISDKPADQQSNTTVQAQPEQETTTVQSSSGAKSLSDRHVNRSHGPNSKEQINIPQHPALSPLELKSFSQTPPTNQRSLDENKPNNFIKSKDLTLKTNSGKAVASICLCQPIPKIPRPRNGKSNFV